MSFIPSFLFPRLMSILQHPAEHHPSLHHLQSREARKDQKREIEPEQGLRLISRTFSVLYYCGIFCGSKKTMRLRTCRTVKRWDPVVLRHGKFRKRALGMIQFSSKDVCIRFSTFSAFESDAHPRLSSQYPFPPSTVLKVEESKS